MAGPDETLQVRTLPLVAAALLVEGSVHAHTSIRGDLAPDLHPVIRRLLHELPVEHRERFLGWCAEPVLLSDRLYAAEEQAGRPLSTTAARAALWGAKLRLTLVREPDDPAHGTAASPCRSCRHLLDWFGIEVIG
ncbi:YwqJ-related putative deaminase [Solwaraspora sp. WMMB335]|uniref:YwqJ-related putative deaminase n=1 Tax=Solwaraspora sp. WMMB335 TaxID=3404118 RepID=UPI003B934739